MVLSEREIIARMEAASRGGQDGWALETGIGDDAAVVRLEEGGYALASDMLIEGTHFDLRYMTLADAAWKALAANVSDMAAMGAQPLLALGNLGVPPGASAGSIEQIRSGLAQARSECAGGALPLIGGDTTSAPQWILSISICGRAPASPLLRSGAQPGDGLWISSREGAVLSLGLSQTGLWSLWPQARAAAPDAFPAAVRAHKRPLPQLALGRWLAETGLASSCLDTSDSLSQSALLLAERSAAGIEVDLSVVPLHSEVLRFCAGLRSADGIAIPAGSDPAGRELHFASLAELLLASSEDYELLFTAPPQAAELLRSAAPAALHRIGRVLGRGAVSTWVDASGAVRPLTQQGFRHLG